MSIAMTLMTKKKNIGWVKRHGFIYRDGDNMMHMYFGVLAMGIAFFARASVSLIDRCSKFPVIGKITNIADTFPISMFFSGFDPIGIKMFLKSFVPCRFTSSGINAQLSESRVFRKFFVDLAPVIVRFVSLLVTHLGKCLANIFGESFVPRWGTLTKPAFMVAVAIFSVTPLTVMVEANACGKVPAAAFARNSPIFINNNCHAVHYTFNIECGQGKLGEFGGTPNVKTRTIPSQAAAGLNSAEGVTVNGVSPNNNPLQERPARKGRYDLSCMDNIQKYSLNGYTITKLNSLPFTFKIETLSEFDIQNIIREGLLDDAVKCIDGDIERQYNATPLRYVGLTTTSGTLTTNGTATATNTSALNAYHMRKMITELKKRNVPGWGKAAGDYAAIASVEAVDSLQGAMESINQYTESGFQKIMNGEVGRIYGCRVIEDTFASRFTYSSSARTATAKSWTGGNSLDAYIFGSPTVMEGLVVPEEIRLKVVTDYGRSKGMAWYGLFGWKIVWDTADDARIIKWDSA